MIIMYSVIVRSRAAWPSIVPATFAADQPALFAAPSACRSLLARQFPAVSVSRQQGRLTTVSMAMAIGQNQKGRTALQEADSDGAFKRRDSVYRHFVQKGSQFEPAGAYLPAWLPGSHLAPRKTPPEMCPMWDVVGMTKRVKTALFLCTCRPHVRLTSTALDS